MAERHAESGSTRVLAFTPSVDGRFLLLDRCIKQMRLQSYPVTHAVHLNTKEPADLGLAEQLEGNCS